MIPGQAEFCLHTAQFKRWISHKEASAVKSFFGLEPDEKLTDEMYFYEVGITRLWIQEVPGKTKTRYYINVILNFARALGSRGYTAMPYTTGNVKKVLNSFSKTLKLLYLSDENSRLQEWTAVRFDSAFDIFEENTRLLMQLLNRSLNLGGTRKKCCRLPIPGKTPEESMSQSARFGNKSYVYNVYRKMEEILDTGKSFTESEKEELLHLLRIERQNLENACKKLLPDGKAGDLAKASVREDILKTMTDEMALFFGKGDFFTWDGIQKKYFPEHEAEIRSVLDVMVQITKTSLEESQEAFTKEAADTFERLGLAPVGIPPGKHSIDSIQGVYTRIVAVYPRPPNKRPYSDFPKPHKTGDGRYKATVTLYQADGTRKQLSVAGRSVADYEQKVLAKLTDVHLRNMVYTAKSSGTARPGCCRKSADSLIRFHKAAKTQSVKKDAEQFIKALKLDIKKPEVHNINGLPSGINSGRAVADKPTQLLESNV